MKKIIFVISLALLTLKSFCGNLPIIASPWTTTANAATALAALGGSGGGSGSLNTTIIMVGGNYVIGADTNLMKTTNVIYSVNTLYSNVVITVPSNFPNSFAVENDNTNAVVITNTLPSTFRVANGTNQPVYANAFSNSYPMKVFWLTMLNATNVIITGERITKAEIQRIADGEIALLADTNGAAAAIGTTSAVNFSNVANAYAGNGSGLTGLSTNVTGNANNTTNLNGLPAGSYALAANAVNTPQRYFYVATNGNNSTAVANNSLLPFAPIFSATNGVCTFATNQGDCIFLLNGNYVATNFPITNGVWVLGQSRAGTILSVSNNGTSSALSVFQPYDNFTIGNLTVNAIPSGYTSILLGNNSHGYTNGLIYNCTINGDYDTFYGNETANFYYRFTIRDSSIFARWDILAANGQEKGEIDSFNNTYQAGNAPISGGGLTRFYSTSIHFIDYGSTFYNFGTNGCSSSTNWLNGQISFYGSVFRGNTLTNMPIQPSGEMSGYYVNGDSGLVASLNPDLGQYFTNSTALVIATNFTFTSITLSNLWLSTNGFTNWGVFSTDGNLSSGRTTWTNSKNAALTLEYNLPADVSLFGPAPTFGVHSNSGAVVYSQGPESGGLNNISSIQGVQFSNDSLEDTGPQPEPYIYFPSTTSTNTTYNTYPSLFNGSIYKGTNGQVTIPNGTFTGNGGGLTNLNAANINGTYSQIGLSGMLLITNAQTVSITNGLTLHASSADVADFYFGATWALRITGSGLFLQTAANGDGHGFSLAEAAGSLDDNSAGVGEYVGGSNHKFVFTSSSVSISSNCVVSGSCSGFVVNSNAWSLPSVTNGMANFATSIVSSNGIPVVVYSSNGVAFVNYLTTPSGGIIP